MHWLTRIGQEDSDMKSLRVSGNFAMEQLQRAASSSLSMVAAVTIALVLTILAVAYQPPDPIFHPSKALTEIFTSVRNSTYEKDDSVLVTGEDLLMVPTGVEAPARIIGPSTKNISVSGTCDPGSTVINCSDPGVLLAIEIANKQKFPDMELFEYGKPVRGSSRSKCDIQWRFKPRKEKSLRMYRDYRAYTMMINSSCDYVVENIGAWHSGKNARSRMDSVNDSISTSRPLNTFWSKKYLYYSRGGDYCKGMNQYLWSFLCALGEAQYLNRTFVVDLDLCLSGTNNPGHQDEEGKDFRFYFDYEHLQEGAAVVEQKQFMKRWVNWDKKHPRKHIPYRVVDDFKISPMQLHGDESTIVWRKFEQPEPNNYWYRVCEGETEKVVQRPWHLLWKSKRLMNIVSSICGKLEWDFDAVHVVRGKKAENKYLWPNLDKDTRPEVLLEKLGTEIQEGRSLYVASNEMVEGYFDKLRTRYRVYMLDDFKSLWATGSQWYNETMALTKNRSVDFDGYMRAQVDSEVFFRAKKRIETFGQLTTDCKDGINTC